MLGGHICEMVAGGKAGQRPQRPSCRAVPLWDRTRGQRLSVEVPHPGALDRHNGVHAVLEGLQAGRGRGGQRGASRGRSGRLGPAGGAQRWAG